MEIYRDIHVIKLVIKLVRDYTCSGQKRLSLPRNLVQRQQVYEMIHRLAHPFNAMQIPFRQWPCCQIPKGGSTIASAH